MTIAEAIERADQFKPNHYTFEQKVAWLSSLDGQVFRELIVLHEPDKVDPVTEFNGYDAGTAWDTELLIPAPYCDDIYLYYLISQMDIGNYETGKYATDHVLFNTMYASYSDAYTRTHMPVQQAPFVRL